MTPSFPSSGPPRIFPAIDLRGGRTVRLIQGRRGAEIDYGADPLETARRWEAEGAECLHVIDLGAAFGEGDSRSSILAIARAAQVPIQAGGGLRDEDAVAALLAGGVARVILGTRALRDPAFLAGVVERHGRERVLVAIDCLGEEVRVAGWEEGGFTIARALALVAEAGADRVLVTATDRDGTLAGPRVELVKRILEAGAVRVVAAGGIGTLEHIASVLAIAHPRLEGVVVGRALYEGAVSLREAVSLASRRKEMP
jgi:phosphoribosylformimino-5-aminoimidazole carboxamide ribotide isomerase